MPTEEIKLAELVTAYEHLVELCAELAHSPRLAIDIESNGFYAYREKVCLLQLSDGRGDYIVDPIAIKDLSPLAPIFADPGVEKIFHAGEYDILCLKRDYGVTFSNVFDTMIANRILGVKELGLAAAIEKHFGVKLSKKLQRADWGRRPLTAAHLQYAQLDTHYLLRLSNIQKELLREKKREDDAADAFATLAEIKPNEKVFDPEGYWRLAGGRNLTGRQLAVLRELYLLRERHAQERNRAPFRVMPEDLLIRLSVEPPSTKDELKNARGMSPYLLERFGRELLNAVAQGLAADPVAAPARNTRERRDPREWKLFEDLRQWRKAKAAEQGVDPVVVVSSAELKEVARLAVLKSADPLKPLSELKRGRLGEEILKIVKQNIAD